MSMLMRLIRLPLSCRFAVIIGTAIWVLLTTPASAGQDAIRIVIDTKALTLKVMQGNREKLTLSNIAIGRYGTTTDKQRGDNKTPLGHFVIAWITSDTAFHRFFGFSYPSREDADRAFRAGYLGKRTWNRIRQAIAAGHLPPQNTVLGGNLGIHGIGKGDPDIHEHYNWTNGCVALTNEQIDCLTVWIRVGTPVEIR
jgi:murein L,D-transpeptidase YafK